jgi:hypothetical protein
MPKEKHSGHNALASKYADTPWLGVPTVDECLDFVEQNEMGIDELHLRLFNVHRINDQRLEDRGDALFTSFAQSNGVPPKGSSLTMHTKVIEQFSSALRGGDKYCHNLHDTLSLDASCAPLAQNQIDNHEAVQLLLGDSEQDVLMRAELLRELARFDDAVALLDREFEEQAVAEQLYVACVSRCADPFTFADDMRNTDYEEAWRLRRYQPEEPLMATGDEYPPAFQIGNRAWWVKVLGMLHHNWALIEENSDGTITSYFFHDQGGVKSPPGYSLWQLKNRSAVVDSLLFESLDQARKELERNGFSRLTETPGPWVGGEPKGFLYDARETEEGIYSRSGYWLQ